MYVHVGYHKNTILKTSVKHATIWHMSRPNFQTLGYEVVRELGSGGFGKVNLVREEGHRRGEAMEAMDDAWWLYDLPMVQWWFQWCFFHFAMC